MLTTARTWASTQYTSLEDAREQFAPGSTVVLQMPGCWNGNNIALARWPICHTYRFQKTHHPTLEAAEAIGNT